MEKKNGFTLIELLAVIIILGILMLIAIPSVSSYINNSRKQSYVSTVKELIKAASTKVNSGEYDINDTNVTYYIDVNTLELENGKATSPYGEFDEAYVVVTFDGDEYNYYYVGKDEENIGIDTLTKIDDIKSEEITTDIEEIDTSIGIGSRREIVVIKEGNVTNIEKTDSIRDSEKYLCIPATKLHTETCKSYGRCHYYYETDSDIKFGNIVENGDLKAGDAFDCDVNGDGYYNSTTERFYYVSDYFDTEASRDSESVFDERYATLIYYRGYSDNKPSDEGIRYSTGKYNSFTGPTNAVNHLPTKKEWKNIELKEDRRSILSYSIDHTNMGTLYAYNNTYNLPTEFSYEGKAARLLTYEELKNGCTIRGQTESTILLANCDYLFERIFEFSGNSFGYSANRGIMLENPYYKMYEFSLIADARSYFVNQLNIDFNYSVAKPVIDVPKSRIDY